MDSAVYSKLDQFRLDLAPNEANYLSIAPIVVGSLYSSVCLVSEPGSGYHYHITDLFCANPYSDVMSCQLYQFTAVSVASAAANLKLDIRIKPFDTKHVQFAGDGLKLDSNRGLAAGTTVAAGLIVGIRGYKEAD